VDVHPRIAARAIEPRYTIPEGASFIDRPTSTVRRWTLGNPRKHKGAARRDKPLIRIDGDSVIPLSFLNLLELRFLAAYRRRVPLQSIRRALDFAGSQLGVDRPLLTIEFQAHGKSLFMQFVAEGEDSYLDASRGGQLAWPAAIENFVESIDYEERTAFRWWPLGRQQPVIVDTTYNGVGKRVAATINLFTSNHGCEAVVQHEVHPQMQLPQQGDEWWIEDATKRGFVIITGNLAIFRTESELATVRRTRARIIGYARATYTGWQKLAGLTSHWTVITEQLEEPGPWILKIYAGPTAPVLMLDDGVNKQ
jgi:hypothetical protein